MVWWPSDKWVMVLEVMQCTHDVFVKHGVTYWLDYRSLLGAIQHKVHHSPPFPFAVAWHAPHYFGSAAGEPVSERKRGYSGQSVFALAAWKEAGRPPGQGLGRPLVET